MRALILTAWTLGCQPVGSVPDGTDDDVDTTPAPTCITPAIRVARSAPDATRIGVPALPRGELAQAARLGGREITLSAVSGEKDALTVELSPTFTLWDADGAPIPAPFQLTAADLPTTVWVTTTGFDDGALTVTSTDDCAAAAIDLDATPRTELAVRALGAAPWAWPFETFRTDDKVDVALDPAELRDRIGLDYAIYVVAHRGPAEWLADNTLVDVTEAVESGTLTDGPLAEHVTRVWGAPRVTDTYASGWDVVVDFGADGRLDPGDLIDGLGRRPGFSTAGDLAALGPYTPVRNRRDDGQWLQQEVWYPAEIQQIDGLLPLVVMSHGNGHDFRWYGHLGEHLASWGFVFMSHANNTGPGIQTAARTTLDNTGHFVANHATWWDGAMAGKVDVHNIAWIGHSRGGEGVVRAYDRLYGGYQPGPYGLQDIRVVSSIAPTVFLGVTGSNPHDIPYHLLAGSADGDVTGGADCAICQSLRLPYAAVGDVAIHYIQGASHNSFHTGDNWDGAGPDQLPQETVHDIQKPIYLALLGWRQRGIDAFKPLTVIHPDVYRPVGMPIQPTMASVWKEADSPRKRTIDAFQIEAAPETNDLGGAVTWDVANLVEDVLDDGNADFGWRPRDPMNGMTLGEGDGWERGVVFDWDGPASYRTQVPEAQGDLRDFDLLSLRACQGTRHPATEAHNGPLVFAVALVDAAGASAVVEVEPFGSLSAPYPRTGLGDGAGWANEMSTIRLPLRVFQSAEPTVDLSQIREVQLLFGPAHGAETGRIGVDDLYVGRW